MVRFIRVQYFLCDQSETVLIIVTSARLVGEFKSYVLYYFFKNYCALQNERDGLYIIGYLCI